MIYFKLIPINGQKNTKYLTFDNSFLTVKLQDVNHEKFLKEELKKQFGVDFNISRSFFVINQSSDIYIYTFVIESTFLDSPLDYSIKNGKLMTKEEILDSDFNKFDKLAIQELIQKGL